MSTSYSEAWLNKQITFSVCGQRFQTTAGTIVSQKPHRLASMLDATERNPLLGTPGMPIFIDRNPALFHTVLDFLRKGHVNLKDKKSWLEDLLDEAQYYRLYSLTTRIMQHIRNLSLQDLIVTGKHSLGVSSFRLEKTSKQNPEVVCSKHLPGGSPDLHTSRGPKKTRSEGSRVGERFQAAVEHHDMTDSCCYTATANTPSSHRFSDYAPAAVLYDPGPLQFSVDEDF